jgi:cysteinyl-tRNA synthetase
MAEKYLGRRFDIHTGGVDHIAVHHTNEVAQSECAWDVHPWVSYWLHNEFLDLRGEKIAKSTGNLVLLDDLVARGVPPLAFRYFFLQAHYRQQQAYTDAAVDAAATGYERLLGACAELRGASGEVDAERTRPLRERFRAAIRDDLNAPRALAVAWEAVRASGLGAAERWLVLREADAVLGLALATGVPLAERTQSDPRIDALVAEREAARERRDFATADRIRRQLAEEGVLIEDTPQGSRWRRE